MTKFWRRVIKEEGPHPVKQTSHIAYCSHQISEVIHDLENSLSLTFLRTVQVLKGHCHGYFWTFLVKRHQNVRLSTFNHAGNAPRTKREGYLANCLKKRVTVNSFHQFFQTTSTKLEKVRLTFSS